MAVQVAAPLSLHLAGLDLARISGAHVAAEVARAARAIVGADDAVLWRHEPSLGRLFLEQAGEPVLSVETSRAQARDLLRAPSVWASHVDGLRRALGEASFDPGAHGSVAALPLAPRSKDRLLLLRCDPAIDPCDVIETAEALVTQAGAVLANWKAIDRARRSEVQLKALSQTIEEISSNLDLDTVLKAIVERARLLVGSPVAYIMLPDAERAEIFTRVTAGTRSPEFARVRLRVGFALGGTAALEERPMYTPDYLRDTQFSHGSVVDRAVRAEGVRSVLAIPMKASETLVGVLYVADREVRAFADADVDVLLGLARNAAFAIENARLYARVTRAVAELEMANETVRVQNLRLERADALHRQLSEIVLAGEGLPAVVRLMSQFMGKNVVLLDASTRTLAVACVQDDDEFSRTLVALGMGERDRGHADADVAEAIRAVRRAAAAVVPVLPPVRRWPWLAVPVVARAEVLGSVWMETSPNEIEEDRGLIEQAVRVIALELLKERSLVEREQSLHRDFLDDLLSARAESDPGLQRRAGELGLDLGARHRLLVTGPVRVGPGESRLDEQTLRGAKAALVAALSAASGCVFVAERSDRVVALLRPDHAREASEAAAARVSGNGFRTRGVLSLPIDRPGQFRGAYRSADQALQVFGGIMREPVLDLDEAQVLSLLLRDGGRDAASFVRRQLGAILALPQHKAHDLLDTLAAHLEHGRSPARTAAALHVHVNTVYYRLERLRQLLGPELDAPRRSLDLQVALTAYRLFDQILEESTNIGR